MSKSVVIIGAGGHGKVIADIVIKSGDKVVGFLDDAMEKGKRVAGIEILGNIMDFRNYPDCEFIVAIGNPEVRERVVYNLEGVKWYTAIHPTAVLSSLEVEIGEGTVIMANAVINSCVKICKHCIINTGAVVEHDNIIDNYVHISPNVTLAGCVNVGKMTHIGAGACVINNVNITKNCIIGAGSTVLQDITKSGTYVGVPVRRIK